MSTYPDFVDFSTYSDNTGLGGLDPNFTRISGGRSRIEMICRRWTTIKGEMDDPDFGYPIQLYYNANMLPVELLALQAGLRNEAKKVEGVEECTVILQRDGSGRVNITASVLLSDEEQPEWRFVFSLSSDLVPRITLLGPEE